MARRNVDGLVIEMKGIANHLGGRFLIPRHKADGVGVGLQVDIDGAVADRPGVLSVTAVDRQRKDFFGNAQAARGFALEEFLGRENLAAGILRLAGWTPGVPLLDPMCGSGTILLEAACMALEILPGLGRHFAFEKFKNFDAESWRELIQRRTARRKARLALPIFGSDIDGAVLKAAQANLAGAGLENVVTLKRASVLEITAPAKEGIIVSNPPYGVRLGEQEALAEFYPKLGDVLKKQFAGWRAYFLSADMQLPKLIRLATSKRTPLFNGALDCRLFEYKMIEGGMRKKPDREQSSREPPLN